jgi:putative ABC transport system permease protein
MKFLPLIWAWLWHRPARTLLAVLAATCAFTLYGLAAGTMEGVQRMAAAQHIATGTGLAMSAAGVCAIGFGLILFLIANATAQSVRLRIGEFGVLKAIGYSHRLIILLVAAEAALPWLAGALLGLGLAQPLLPRLIALLPFPAGFPEISYTAAMLAGAVALALLLGAASAAVPALRITQLEVAAALTGGFLATTARGEAATPIAARFVPASPATGTSIWRQVPKADPHLLRQVAMMTRIGIGTLSQRWKGAVAVMTALLVVTLVMNPLLILIDSFRGIMAQQGSPMNVMITQPGLRTWRDGRIPLGWADAIKHLPGIARSADGTPIAEAPSHLDACAHPEAKPGERDCIGIEGLEASGAALHPPRLLLAGRLNRPGTHEIIMSANTAAQHQVKVGTRMHLQGQEWQVTGIFELKTFWVQGTSVGDAMVVRAAAGGGFVSFVVARLASPADLQRISTAVQTRFRLNVDREDAFYNGFASGATRGWMVVCYVVGILFGVGAGAGIFHLMEVTVEARAAEMGVLRALGFSGAAVASCVVLEAMLLATAGTLLGMFILWLWLDGAIYRGSMSLAVQWGRVAVAVGWSLGIALLGSLSPALSAVRREVAEALRK